VEGKRGRQRWGQVISECLEDEIVQGDGRETERHIGGSIVSQRCARRKKNKNAG